jgi:membrane fusion protein (multidrug efflux system)
MNSHSDRPDSHVEPAAHARRRHVLPIALLTAAAGLLILGIVPRLHASTALSAQTHAQSALVVSVIKPRSAPAQQALLLPGSVTPFADAAIYARTSGYVQRWTRDIGAKVTAGETLAIIQTPELDAQLAQARADEATARASFAYADATAKRWQQMLTTQSVSQQDADTKISDRDVKRAMLQSAVANVKRLSELVSYEKVTAPFSGVITARNVDVGALVSAGSSPGLGGNTGELFHVQQTDTLRVFVDVPQNEAPYVTSRTSVYLSVQQFPGKRFAAKVVRDTGSIDPVSRTLRVEVDVDNRDGALMPGAYAQVHLGLDNPHPALDLPVSALLFRPDGVTVAVVDAAGKTALKSVGLGRDFGTSVEVTTGLNANDRVIDNPGDAISAGQSVRIAPNASNAS